MRQCQFTLKVCLQAFSSLAEAAYENAPSSEDEEPLTYILSGKFNIIVEKLIATAERLVSYCMKQQFFLFLYC